VRPHTIALGNLFRDQLDRYGELEAVAERWRAMIAELAPGTTLVACGDDPLTSDLASHRDPAVVYYGIDDPALAQQPIAHAADSRFCVRCGTPYRYEAIWFGHLGDYRCPACGHARPPLAIRATGIEQRGLESVSFELQTPVGSRRIELGLPGLYNVENALGASGIALALGASLDEVADGLARFQAAFGRFQRLSLDDREAVMLLIKNPAGANEAVRTLVDGASPRVLVVALNDEIADGRDVSWIWDVDFEPLLPELERLVASGGRAAELALRFRYGGLDDDAIDVEPDLAAALDRGLELTPVGGELVVLPTYTAMLGLQRILTARGLTKAYWS
jgi:UDP-N-acetylmuramyl tripeptide synthase